MLPLLASLAISLVPAMPSASVTCAEAPASCDGAWLAAPVEVADGPVDYATPAEVECPSPVVGAVQDGTCDALPLDQWYRVSRVPDSESGGTTVAPARRSRGVTSASSCGTPPDATHLAPPATQLLALYAVPALLPDPSRFTFTPDARVLPARALAPPDRPPRV